MLHRRQQLAHRRLHARVPHRGDQLRQRRRRRGARAQRRDDGALQRLGQHLAAREQAGQGLGQPGELFIQAADAVLVALGGALAGMAGALAAPVRGPDGAPPALTAAFIGNGIDPATAAGKFFDRLVQVPGWRGMPPWNAAQTVQGSPSSDGGIYREMYEKAETIVTEEDVADAGDQNPRHAPLHPAHVQVPLHIRYRLHADRHTGDHREDEQDRGNPTDYVHIGFPFSSGSISSGAK